MSDLIKIEKGEVTISSLKEKLDEIDKAVYQLAYDGFYGSRLAILMSMWRKGKEVALYRGVKGAISYRELERETGKKREDLKRWNDLYEKYPRREDYQKVAEPQAASWTKKALGSRLSLPAVETPPLPLDYKLPENCLLINADFREYLPGALSDNSIDLILTDPPYDEESLPLWDSLGEQAARLLRPGGALITYSGQNFLGQVIERVCKHLNLYWMIAVHHTHGQLRMWEKHIWNSWKPVIIWSKGKVEHDWFSDFISLGQADTKEYYEFSQPVDQAKYLIEKFSQEEDILLDPMVGAGTTMLAARQCNRRCIGIEIKEDVYLKAKRRFFEAAQKSGSN